MFEFFEKEIHILYVFELNKNSFLQFFDLVVNVEIYVIVFILMTNFYQNYNHLLIYFLF